MATNVNNQCPLCNKDNNNLKKNCIECNKPYHRCCLTKEGITFPTIKEFKNLRNWKCPECQKGNEVEIRGQEGLTINSYQEKACGIEKSLPGILLQLRLTEYLILKSIELELKFEIFKENEDFRPFDDIVFKYRCNNSEDSEWNFFFIQSKHKQKVKNENFVITKELFIDENSREGKSGGVFKLTDYFKAYIVNKDAFSKCNGKINFLVVFTNASLDANVKCLMKSCENTILKDAAIFNYCDDIVLHHKTPEFLQIKTDCIEYIGKTLVSETESGRLAKELIDAVFIDDKKLSWENSLFKRYYEDLEKLNIIKIEHTNSGNFGRCSFGNFQCDNEECSIQKFRHLLISIAWKMGMEYKNGQKFAVSNCTVNNSDDLMAKDLVHELVQLDSAETDNVFYFLGHSKIESWIETKTTTRKRKHFVLNFPNLQIENINNFESAQFFVEVMEQYFNIYVSDKEIHVDESFKIAFSPKNYKVLANSLVKSCEADKVTQHQSMEINLQNIRKYIRGNFAICLEFIGNMAFKVNENESVSFANQILNEEVSNLPNKYVSEFKKEIVLLCNENPNWKLKNFSWVMNDIFKNNLVQCCLPKHLEEEFLQKFVLAIDQPDEDQLEHINAGCLGRRLKYNYCDEFMYDFQKKTMNWVKGRTKTSLNNEIVEKYIDEYLLKINSCRLQRKERKLVENFKRLSL